MYFMNESEVRQAKSRWAKHKILGPATRFLADFVDMVNANSDGWHSWPGGARAARQLMLLIEQGQAATEAQLRKALVPIKSLCTRRKLPCPTLEEI
jgi:hypothetical protein